MKVSIIIPAHNEEKYIGRTIEAVKKIDYPDFEIIVVDNASTDNTTAVAKSYDGVKVLYEPNKGTQWTRERGRKEATGEIIGNLDADCIPETDWLTIGVKGFEDPNVVMVNGPYYYYDASPFFRLITLQFQRIVYRFTNFVCRITNQGAVSIGGNCLLRSETLKKIGGYDTSILFYGDDTDTAKRMSIQGKVVFNSDMIVDSSARRFKNQGLMKTLYNYLFFFLKTTIFPAKKPL